MIVSFSSSLSSYSFSYTGSSSTLLSLSVGVGAALLLGVVDFLLLLLFTMISNRSRNNTSRVTNAHRSCTDDVFDNIFDDNIDLILFVDDEVGIVFSCSISADDADDALTLLLSIIFVANSFFLISSEDSPGDLLIVNGGKTFRMVIEIGSGGGGDGASLLFKATMLLNKNEEEMINGN